MVQAVQLWGAEIEDWMMVNAQQDGQSQAGLKQVKLKQVWRFRGPSSGTDIIQDQASDIQHSETGTERVEIALSVILL